MTSTKLDTLYSHSKNVGLPQDRIGTFCGSPIVTLDQRAIDIDNILDISRTIEANKSFTSEPVELNILPGEIVCEDGVIRRGTTAEVLGDVFYDFAIPKDTKQVSIAEARLASLAGALVYFRPDNIVGEGEFALLHEEVTA
jgi:hypothetical protein